MSTERILKLTLYGNTNTGKTSIAKRIAMEEPKLDEDNTIGVDFFIRKLLKYNTRITIWDLSGQRRFENITITYLRPTQIILYVYDISRYSTIKDLKRMYTNHCLTYNIKDKTIIVIGNKSDLERPYNTCRELGEKFAREIQAHHITTSSRDNTGIDEIISHIIEKQKLKIIDNPDSVEICKNCIIL